MSVCTCICFLGGGPEIIALSNFFECPIHVYELSVLKGEFCLRPKALFGIFLHIIYIYIYIYRRTKLSSYTFSANVHYFQKI